MEVKKSVWAQEKGSRNPRARLCSHCLFLRGLELKQNVGAAHVGSCQGHIMVQHVWTHPWVLAALHPFVLNHFSCLLAEGEAIIN